MEHSRAQIYNYSRRYNKMQKYIYMLSFIRTFLAQNINIFGFSSLQSTSKIFLSFEVLRMYITVKSKKLHVHLTA